LELSTPRDFIAQRPKRTRLRVRSSLACRLQLLKQRSQLCLGQTYGLQRDDRNVIGVSIGRVFDLSFFDWNSRAAWRARLSPPAGWQRDAARYAAGKAAVESLTA